MIESIDPLSAHFPKGVVTSQNFAQDAAYTGAIKSLKLLRDYGIINKEMKRIGTYNLVDLLGDALMGPSIKKNSKSVHDCQQKPFFKPEIHIQGINNGIMKQCYVLYAVMICLACIVHSFTFLSKYKSKSKQS